MKTQYTGITLNVPFYPWPLHQVLAALFKFHITQVALMFHGQNTHTQNARDHCEKSACHTDVIPARQLMFDLGKCSHLHRHLARPAILDEGAEIREDRVLFGGILELLQ